MKKRALFILSMLLTIVPVNPIVTSVPATDVPRITKEQLLSILAYEDIFILDLRAEKGWEISKWKIKGAIHENPRSIQSWLYKYPKEKTFILY